MSLKFLGWTAAIVAGTLVYVSANSPKPEAPKAPQPDVPIPSVSIGDVNMYWRFSESTDRMTGKTTSSAELISENSLSLRFPYSGENYGHIEIRRSPRYGLDAMIGIRKGQILCHSYDCSVLVRFDEKPPVRFSGAEPSDGSTNLIFVQPAAKFLALAKTAKRIQVEIELYQEGRQVLDFVANRPLSKF